MKQINFDFNNDNLFDIATENIGDEIIHTLYNRISHNIFWSIEIGLKFNVKEQLLDLEGE